MITYNPALTHRRVPRFWCLWALRQVRPAIFPLPPYHAPAHPLWLSQGSAASQFTDEIMNCDELHSVVLRQAILPLSLQVKGVGTTAAGN